MSRDITTELTELYRYDINRYQIDAESTASGGLQGRNATITMALGLAGEAGEAVEFVKKWWAHGHELDTKALKKELGDLFWYLAGMATNQGWTLSEIAAENRVKLLARYPAGFTTECSLLRCKCGHHCDDHADDTVFLHGNEGSSITTFACTQCRCGDYDGPDGGSA